MRCCVLTHTHTHCVLKVVSLLLLLLCTLDEQGHNERVLLPWLPAARPPCRPRARAFVLLIARLQRRAWRSATTMGSVDTAIRSPVVAASAACLAGQAEHCEGATLFPEMDSDARVRFCETAPWWTAPVIVGGSGGSGTRGSLLLLSHLGVGMACTGRLFDRDVFNERQYCNNATDFSLLGGYSVWKQSWLRTPLNCTVGVREAALMLSAPAGAKGLTASHLSSIRRAVLPAYRQRLRWGMKNPHATYTPNVLLRFFPCMLHFNTMRDLPEMVRNMDHMRHRENEARTFGMLPPNAMQTIASQQSFLAMYLYRVNVGLREWADRCMAPHQAIFVPVMRIARCHSHVCTKSAAFALAHALRHDVNTTMDATEAYATASHEGCMKSHDESSRRELLVPTELLPQWPRGELGLPRCPCSHDDRGARH